MQNYHPTLAVDAVVSGRADTAVAGAVRHTHAVVLTRLIGAPVTNWNQRAQRLVVSSRNVLPGNQVRQAYKGADA